MQKIGEEKNDPRFKNWGLTSLFRSTLALEDLDEANEILPEMQKYIDEYGESMYNSVSATLNLEAPFLFFSTASLYISFSPLFNVNRIKYISLE